MVGQIGGPIGAVAARGKLAYAGVGMRLSVLDLSDPAEVRELGATEFLGGSVEAIHLDGDTAVVAAGGAGLHLVDVGDPSRPKSVSRLGITGYAEGVTVAAPYAYVAAGSGGLQVVDISDPAAPRGVAALDGSVYTFDAAVAGGYAYLAAAGAGLVVADIRDPLHPFEVARLALPGYAYGIAVTGSTAYVAGGWEGVRVVDISDPRTPREVASHRTPGWAMGVVAAGTTLYGASAGGGLRAIDVSDRERPRALGAFETPRGHAEGLAVTGDIALVADRNAGLHVVDVSAPAVPERVSLYRPLGFADGVAVSGAHAFAAAGRYGLRVVDVSDPTRPREIAAVDLPRDDEEQSASTVVLVGRAAYVTVLDDQGLHVVDVSDPEHPIDALAFQLPGRFGYSTPRNQFVSGTGLYVAAEDTFVALDVSDPFSPCELRFLSFSGDRTPTLDDPGAAGIAVSGDVAYVAAGNAGLLLMDVSDPRHPAVLSAFSEPMPGAADRPLAGEDVTASGHVAYVFGQSHIRLVDVSDPRRPRGLGSVLLPTNNSAWGPLMARAGNVLYVADGDAGLLAVDVSDPSAPRVTARLRLPGRASAVAVDGRYVYVAAERGGLVIVGPGPGPASMAEADDPVAGVTPAATAARVREVPSAATAGASEGPPRLEAVGSAMSAPVHGQRRRSAVTAASTCNVTSTADSGPGTLRACLGAAGSGGHQADDGSCAPGRGTRHDRREQRGRDPRRERHAARHERAGAAGGPQRHQGSADGQLPRHRPRGRRRGPHDRRRPDEGLRTSRRRQRHQRQREPRPAALR